MRATASTTPLLAFTGDPDVAREAVAESFARALASESSIRDVVPWVWKVAFRLASSDLKDRKRLTDASEIEERPVPSRRTSSRLSHSSPNVREPRSSFTTTRATPSTRSPRSSERARERSARTFIEGALGFTNSWRKTMNDLAERLREIERNPSPDLWEEITGRHGAGSSRIGAALRLGRAPR